RWRGVDLRSGANRFVATVLSETGQVLQTLTRNIHYASRPASAALVREASRLVADGVTIPTLAVRLRDKFGEPVRPGVLAKVNIAPPHQPYDAKTALQRSPVLGIDAGNSTFEVGIDGIIQIRLAPTTQAGDAHLSFEFDDGRSEQIRAWLEPPNREWILVGLANLTLSEQSISGNIEHAQAQDLNQAALPDENGRLAFFAKGTIEGKWLLTLAYDSAKEDREIANRLDQLIDPDEHYTLYGDETEQTYDAASASKLYVKVERERFYAVFGDIDTNLTATELSRFKRRFTGLKSEYRGSTLEYNMFAAHDSLAQSREELRGDGTSGLYRLSKQNITLNSETITIEVRNRTRTEIIESTRVLARHIDYDIDYDAGTVFFRQPIRSRDAAFNPVFIVVEYETDSAAEDALVAGGRLAVKIRNDQIEAGATAIRQDSASGDTTLLGTDLTFRIDNQTVLRVEHARTSGKNANGDADGEATIVELRRQSEKSDASLYYRRIDESFGLNQQRNTERGVEKLGADLRYKLSERLTLSGEAFQRRALPNRATERVAQARVEFQESDYALHAGARVVHEKQGAETRQTTQVTAGASRRFLDGRLSTHIDTEISLNNDENAAFPTRAVAGAEYRITPALSVYADQEVTFGRGQHRSLGTLVGVRATPWTGARLHSSVGRRDGELGARVFGNLGISQKWVINDRWSTDVSFDRSQTLDRADAAVSLSNAPRVGDSLNEDFTAVSLGLGYQHGAFDGAVRAEWRSSDREDKWGLRGATYRTLSKGTAFSSESNILFTRSASNGSQTDAGVRLSLVHRPLASPWTLLNRLDFVYEDRNTPTVSDTNIRVINNLNLNYQPNKRSQLGLHYGAKYVAETIGNQQHSGFTQTVGLEFRRSLTQDWDIGVRASLLHSSSTRSYIASLGASIGYSPAQNVWIGAGYNIAGYRDDDFSNSEFTQHGPFLQLRIKADQNTLKAIRNRLRSSPAIAARPALRPRANSPAASEPTRNPIAVVQAKQVAPAKKATSRRAAPAPPPVAQHTTVAVTQVTLPRVAKLSRSVLAKMRAARADLATPPALVMAQVTPTPITSAHRKAAPRQVTSVTALSSAVDDAESEGGAG
ncbi:MAG: hypothetical protein K0U93_08075, partial [Gammaproteobacteria bacterium]|nr:hypothetical protein [Gammaproteobacteria bacterium]